MLWNIWWFWAAAALGLAILGMQAPGYILLGFAIGSAAVAALLYAGVALASWLVLRQVFGIRKRQVKVIRDDINED